MNVDAVRFIEQSYVKDGELPAWRKSRHKYSSDKKCTEYGVDLNRNYGYKWSTQTSDGDKATEC